MKGLILEGPDGAGKSHTASEISEAVNLPIYHAGGPPKNKKELLDRIEKMQKMEGFLFDRYPLISDLVYGPVLRGELNFDESRVYEVSHPVIYCRPSIGAILNSRLEAKPHKLQEHVDKVTDNIIQIIERYDEVMKRIPHIKFNRDEQTCADLISLLEKLRS